MGSHNRLGKDSSSFCRLRFASLDQRYTGTQHTPQTRFLQDLSCPPPNDLHAMEAPPNAPRVFISTSVIEGYRTGENTWYSSQRTDRTRPPSAASRVNLLPGVARTLA